MDANAALIGCVAYRMVLLVASVLKGYLSSVAGHGAADY
jgi:hypothetical protein